MIGLGAFGKMTMATIAFLNGEVLSVNENNDVFEAVALAGNKIIAVGSNEEIQGWISEETNVIDLEGKTLMPGIIDAHLHLIFYGTSKLSLNCKDPKYDSIEKILEDLKEKATTTAVGEWIRAVGFNETKVAELRFPTKKELDAVSTEHPIIINRTCSHIGVANSAALALAGINEHTKDPSGGMIERDAEGQLTGKLIESAFMSFNEVSAFSNEEIMQAIELAQQHFYRYGITSVHDAATYDANSFRLLQLASHQGKLKVRVYAMIGSLNDCYAFTKSMLASGVVTGTGNERFKIGPAKLFTDGSSSGPTIATRDGYTSDANNHGILYYTEEELYEVLGKAHELGYQITVHAQGDQAIEMYLNVVERALAEHPREDHRHRIEHAGVSMPDLQARMKALNVIPISNPPFPYEFGEIYLEHYGERTDYMYAMHDYIQQGIIAAASSDAPVTTANPMIGIHTAVNREVNNGKAFGPQQKIELHEILRAYTYNAAYASFEEKLKGSIEVGKLADVIVLDQAITKTNPKALKDVRVEVTVIDGEIVFEKRAVHEG